jgi:hypothetical protein
MTGTQKYRQYLINFLNNKIEFITTVPDFPSEIIQKFQIFLADSFATSGDDRDELEFLAIKIDAAIDEIETLGFSHYRPVN